MKNTSKKIMAGALALAMVMPTSIAFADKENVTVLLNGDKLNFDVAPIIKNDRTLVPMRAIFEALGCNVSYYQYDGEQYINAYTMGKYIDLQVGKANINIDGIDTALDVAPEIIDDRTLIPLRAVSEALDCKVDWDEATSTVSINQEQGQYKIYNRKYNKSIKAEDGTLLMDINCVYPEVDNPEKDSFFDSVNEYYKTRVEKLVDEIVAEYEAVAKEDYANKGAEFNAMEISSNYKVTINRKNWLSITTMDYTNLGGAHPNTTLESKSYQMFMGKELCLYDVLKNVDFDQADQFVYDKFDAKVKEILQGEDVEYKKLLNEEKGNVNFYITDDSVVMYFNPYQILPYAYGQVNIELPYGEGEVGIDLDGYNADQYSFNLSGNPTTGYTWHILEIDEDIISVDDSYKVDENDNEDGVMMVGVGGIYTFTVKGIKEGYAKLTLVYSRPWEDESDVLPLEKRTYKFKVSADNKVTVISEEYIFNHE